MYNENFVRMENGTGRMRRSGEAWNALAEFAKMFMDEYYPDNDDVRRSYNRFSDGENHHIRYRNQPRTSTGRFKSMRFGHEHSCEIEKEEIGSALANAHGQEWLVEKAIEEASEFIKAATKHDEYEMFKEFCELCVLMKGVAEFIPEDLEEQACMKALEYYSKKADMMRYSNPLLDEYTRRMRPY